MPEPLVSILIPVYNSEAFLRASIESALSQTYSNLEVIAVNDGSTDNSLKILQEYDDKIIIVNQDNLGLPQAANSGIKKMTGDWLKWLSPDDILKPNAIQILIDETKKLPENSILYSNWDMIDEDGKFLRRFNESNFNDLPPIDFVIRLFDGQQININTSLIPKNLFSNGCFFRELDDPVAVDYDFFLRAGLFFETRFFLIEKSLLEYRVHSSQLSHVGISKTLSFIDSLKQKLISELDSGTQDVMLKKINQYQKSKPFSKKSMKFGFKLINTILPEYLTDKIMLLYLNKLRKNRY